MDFSARLGEGLSHHRAGRYAEAIPIYHELLESDAGNADILYFLAAALHQNGNDGQALPFIEQAIAAHPNNSACLNVLGLVLSGLGRDVEAAEAFRRAIALDASSSEAQENLDALLDRWCDRGDAHQRAGQLGEAMAAYGTALKLDEDLARAWYAVGCVQSGRKNHALARECFERALKRAPEWPESQHNLGRSLFELGYVDEALRWFARAANGPDPEMPLAMTAVAIPGSPGAHNQAILDARRDWADRYHQPAITGRPERRSGRNRLRIGYVSSFFARDNWMKPVWTLINHHDRDRFEIHLFSDNPPEAIKHGYRRDERDGFHNIGSLSNEEAAEFMHATELDLAVDLNGFSKMQRIGLFTYHPAPVVAGWFNLYATTGSCCYDYLIGDAEVIPAQEERFYNEKVLRVPDSYLAFEINYPVPDVAERPADAGEFNFGCLAPQYKISEKAISAWSEILRQTPGSKLLLKNTTLGIASNREFVALNFAMHGIDRARLILEGPAEHFAFLETYARVDLALDTFPYNGGTTTTEAIWQGVPVLAMWGDRWVARTSASILRAGGLGEFVRRDLDEYIATAVHWAHPGQRQALRELRAGMRAKLSASRVCDGAKFAREMERLYLSIC